MRHLILARALLAIAATSQVLPSRAQALRARILAKLA